MKTNALFDLSKSIAAPLLEKHEYPWQALKSIKDYVIELGKTLDKEKFDEVGIEITFNQLVVTNNN